MKNVRCAKATTSHTLMINCRARNFLFSLSCRYVTQFQQVLLIFTSRRTFPNGRGMSLFLAYPISSITRDPMPPYSADLSIGWESNTFSRRVDTMVTMIQQCGNSAGCHLACDLFVFVFRRHATFHETGCTQRSGTSMKTIFAKYLPFLKAFSFTFV